ncbi:MAG TPA: NarK family nitrate/nitrite MFS transporter [Leptospiraceae bacterium]|nr:NarK family nitrate/nitrite MFS transporter [Leptospiraceae bacterium]
MSREAITMQSESTLEFKMPEVKTNPRTIEHWDLENESFWKTTGRAIALRNLAFSIFAEFLAFTIWQVWSAVATQLPAVGFKFTLNELFWLAALPGLTGATLRMPYAFMVPIVGGRNWTLISTALLLFPAVGIVMAVQNPETPYWVFLTLALLCGFGGGNFASSMANINFFFPKRRKGFALGLNAAGGNIGVSVVQFVTPLVIGLSIFGSFGGSGQMAGTKTLFLQNAALIWIPFIVIAFGTTWFFMNNLHVSRSSVKEQLTMLKDKNAWIMSLLYMGTFGSFIGYSAGFPLLIKSQFPNVNPLQFAFIGPLVGSVIRPVGGWLGDKIGGARVTFWNFAVMGLAVSGVIYFLSIKTEPGAFYGFFAMFLILFVAAGIGNGSTYRMIPIIYMRKNNAHEGATATTESLNRANRQSGVVVGITSAIAAYGAFFVPKSYGTSIELTGGPSGALILFLAFYIGCLAATYYFYYRKKAAYPC